MRKLACLAGTLAALLAASCGSNTTPPAAGPPQPAKLIVGKWKFADAEEQAMEFKADGALTMTGQEGAARYQLADDGATLTITSPNGRAEKFKFTVSPDELTLTDAEESEEKIDPPPQKETLKFLRAK